MNFQNLMNNIPGTFYRCACDSDWTMQFMSDGIEQLAGYSASEIVDSALVAFASLIHPEDADLVERAVLSAVDQNTSWDVEYRLRHSDGVYRWVSEQGVGIYSDDGQVMYLDGFVADVSERRAIQEALRLSEERVKRLAYFDTVTGLPNRNLIFQTINDRLESDSLRELPFALVFVDLDGFKPINDQFGHASGDEVLRVTGQRIKALIGEQDLIARIGGDEFLVLFWETSTSNVEKLTNQILKLVSRPIKLSSSSCNAKVTASAGIATYPTHGTTLDTLLAASDSAMYRAKDRGKNTSVTFSNLKRLDNDLDSAA